MLVGPGGPVATSRPRAPAYFPVPWRGYLPHPPADATPTPRPSSIRGGEPRPYALASTRAPAPEPAPAALLAEGICHVGSCRPILPPDRAAGAGAGKDHPPFRTDPAPRRGLRRPTRTGRGAAVVEGRRLPGLQRHPQQQTHEIRAGQRRLA